MDLADLIFVLIAVLHPALFVLALLQYAVRRWPMFCRGALALPELFGWPVLSVTPFMLVLLPGLGEAVMSSDGSDIARTGSEPLEPIPVRAHQNQIEPLEPAENEPPIALASLRNMRDEELIALLAVMRSPNGGYRFSANEILKIVGGTAADVKAQVAALRPKAGAPAAQRPGGPLYRPENGW
jgi:hypothetical protein